MLKIIYGAINASKTVVVSLQNKQISKLCCDFKSGVWRALECFWQLS